MKQKLIKKKTLVYGYAWSVGLFVLSGLSNDELTRKGYVTAPRHGVPLTGNDGLLLGKALAVLSVILLGVSIYYTILYLRQDITDEVGIESDKTYICIKCDSAYSGNNIEDLICNKCGAELEISDGFYERHPELK